MMFLPVRQSSRTRATVFTACLLLSVTGTQLADAQNAAIQNAAIQNAAMLAPVAAAQAGQASAPKSLQIVILDGEDALNNIRDRTAREPIVEIQDENHKPVAGVLVLFTIHSGTSGAGAAAGGLSSLSVTTGVNGQAILQGFQINQVAGSYTIDVQAKLGDLTAQNTIHETNSTSSAPSQTTPQANASVGKTAGLKHGKYLVGAAVAGLAVAILLGVHAHETGISAGAGSVHP